MLPLEVKLVAPNGLEITQPTGLFINNEFLPSKSNETLEVIDPASNAYITQVYSAGEEDVDYAVQVARKAFKQVWKYKSGDKRGELLFKLADLIEKNIDTLATIEAWDSGKVYKAESYPNIQLAAKTFKYYGGWADKTGGKTIEVGPNKFAYTLHEPFGVCGQIVPWNYPFLMAAWKIAPAIAAGNVVILKLAENTPLSMLYLSKLIVEAGFPPGVINIFTGLGRVAGAALAGHFDVDKIAFTGSTATGRIIMKLAASNLKNITLECGGKSPMIIFEDADISKAAQFGHLALMTNQGQICTAMSRFLVHESVYEKFIALFKEAVQKISKIGHPFDKDSFHGPQISDVQHKKVLDYIASGTNQGGRLVIGGKTPGEYSPGFFVEPTIFADVTDDMTIMKEEIFGPVASVSKFTTEEEAIERANNTSYGLGASVFTKDLVRAHRVARELESGQVWINSGNDSDYRIPFGGYKSSGIGRELGEYGLETYTQTKAVHVNMKL